MSPDVFSLDAVEEFVERYTGVDDSSGEGNIFKFVNN